MKISLKNRIINISLIFTATVLPKISSALMAHPVSSDACLYMNIARNMVEGHGFYCSYNFYQYWGADHLFYPALVFMHPLFPLMAAVVWSFFHSLAAVCVANLILSGINGVILYLILERMYLPITALFGALLVSAVWLTFIVSIYPWSEELHLFFVLMAMWFIMGPAFPHKRPNIFWAGFFVGLSCLARVSGIYNLVIFPAVMVYALGFSRKSMEVLFLFFAGFLAVLLPYETVCFLKYHLFYPDYPHCARVFNSSVAVGGGYFPVKPVLRLPAGFKFHFLSFFMHNFPRHLQAFFNTAKTYLDFMLWVVLIKGLLVMVRRKFDECMLWGIGLGHILLFSLSFYWLPTHRLETGRYLFIPVVCLVPLGVAAVYEAVGLLKQNPSYTRPGLALFFAFFLIITFDGDLRYKADFPGFRANGPEKLMFRWVMDHSSPSDLIATTEYQTAFDLDRPVVSMPEGRMVNDLNMKDFLNIYHPRYILLRKFAKAYFGPFLDKSYHEQELPPLLNGLYAVYKR